MVIRPIIEHLRHFTSLAILVTIASMFLILSCHCEPFQFNQGFGYYSSANSCEEHTLQSGNPHADKGIFDEVSFPERKVLIAALVVAVFLMVYPKLSERYNNQSKVALLYHQRKRWVWARHTPFSSSTFFPYFAATRDQ